MDQTETSPGFEHTEASRGSGFEAGPDMRGGGCRLCRRRTVEGGVGVDIGHYWRGKAGKVEVETIEVVGSLVNLDLGEEETIVRGGRKSRASYVDGRHWIHWGEKSCGCLEPGGYLGELHADQLFCQICRSNSNGHTWVVAS